MLRFGVAVYTAALSIGCTAAPAWSQGPGKDGATNLPERPPVVSRVVWSVVAEPVVAVKGTDDLIHVAYELLFNNVTDKTLRIEALEAIDPSADDAVVGQNQVVTRDDDDVTGQVRLFSRQSSQVANNYSFDLPGGVGGIVYMNLMFAHEIDVPRKIAHRVTISQPDANGAPEITSVGALTKIQSRAAVVISPPLRGDGWIDADGCCTIIGPHRFTIIPINGTEWVAQHFAIDFVQLDDQGRIFTGDPMILGNWHYYGADVLAAAGGKVIKVVNDLPDQVPFTSPTGITIETADGNHVVIAMRNGRYALYAHMIPGSIVVREGDVVRTGQLLGQLGNSGNSDGPHLHFHVMTEASPLETVGLPFVFDRMELQGRLVGSLDQIEQTLISGMPPQIDFSDAGRRRRQMPLTNDLLGFE